ncbi:DNA internalization-related competence protein ComEC/Rec2 [Nakamurella sp.]|uniref:DNA internalization-related competence protein ComEC/Rec2 n=1 Tax=Nakamurella sp. TaxID=1869182 RepID=UPI003783BB15
MFRAVADEENAVPPDLRLVPGALALWVGTVVVLLGGPQLAWWIAGPATVGVLGLFLIRPVGWTVGLPVLTFLIAAAAIAGLREGARSGDCVTLGAGQRSWAHLTGTVVGFPERVASGFGAGDGTVPADRGARPDMQRWRVPIRVDTAEIAGRASTSTVGVTVMGTGDGWATLLPGQQIDTSGRLAASMFAGRPSVSLAARDPPDVRDPAPAAYRLAGTVRSALHDTAGRLDGDAVGLLPGLVVGDTGGIDERLDTDAKATGISHLLAVSGSHFAVLCGFVIVVLRRFGPRVAASGAAVTLVGLVILVGPEPSVLRAAVMGGVGVLALFSGRTRTSLPALAAAVILLLLLDSDLAVSAGFALSVLATGGLVLLAPLWSKAWQRRGLPAGWADLLAIPIAAQVVTMPVIVVMSGSVSIVGVLANLLVAPVVAPALVLGMLCALIGPWWPGAADMLAQVVAPLLNWIATVAHTLARWPQATVPWPATPVGATLLIAATVAIVVLLRRRWFRLFVVAGLAGVTVVLVPIGVVAPGWPVDGWLLVACEVGQGDALVLSTGEPGTAIVVDTGPDPGLVDGCLSRLGVGSIALIVLTHLHADHVDGLSGALDGRSVGMIAVGPGREPATAWREVNGLAAERGVPVTQFRPGDVASVGDATLAVLGPAGEFRGTDSDPNNDSLVIMADLGGTRILLTGDIEIEAQQALLNAGVDLDADVLKAPHHGSSKLLERFVDQVSPEVAVIGVGADNDYGHPSPKALSLLDREGVRTVLRTDTQGDVAVGRQDGDLVAAERGPTLRSRPG